MKKIFKIISAFVFQFMVFYFQAFSQNPLVKMWDKRYGGTDIDYLFSLLSTQDGGYILGGYSYSGTGGDKTDPLWGIVDYWIVKIDASGAKQWDKNFGGTSYDYLHCIEQTNDGGYILGGTSHSGIGGDKTQATKGGYDYWIIKLDSTGSKEWDKDFGGIYLDWLCSVHQTTDGGYILGGYSSSGMSGDKTQPSWGGLDYWILKLDSAGNKKWDKDFGGTSDDAFTSLRLTADGGYILGGLSNSGIGGDKTQVSWGSDDYWIVKIDSAGSKQWDKDFGGINSDWLYSLQLTADGGYVLGGLSNSNISGDKTQASWGDLDYWIVKLDSAGIKQWDKDFGGTDNEDEFGNVTQTSDGGFLIAGCSYSPLSGNKTENNLGIEQTWIIKTDSLGSKEWDKTVFTFGHDENSFAVQANYGCYTFANYTDAGIGGYKTEACQGNYDYWIIKFCDTVLTTSSLTMTPAQAEEKLEVTPNPLITQSKLTFKNTGKEKFVFTLYDITGRITETICTINNEIILTKGNKQPGVYLFNFVNEKTGEMMNGKIVISDK